MSDQSPRCRLCGDTRLEATLTMDPAPPNISGLLRNEGPVNRRTIRLEARRCEGCGFIQLTQELDATFYDEYIMTVSHAATMQNFQSQQARTFVERFGLAGRRVIELGCGDGNYLDHLRAAGAHVVGNEPSTPFRALAVERGHQVMGGYIGKATPAQGGPYDAFVTRQVLEHVPDPRDFLAGISASLADGAVGLVEVPCIEQTMRHQRYFDFFPDHLNYFTKGVLGRLLEQQGFEVLGLEEGMNGEFTVAFVRWSPRAGVSALQSSLDNTTAELQHFIAAERKAGRRVAAWGAGGKGIASLTAAGLTDLAYVIDSDPHKQGKRLPGVGLLVVPPSHLAQEPVASIILTALAYRSEIINTIRNELRFGGRLLVLGDSLHESVEVAA
ncbi:MAG: methyltransferase domain-containing protein [Gemmatimonas sp.]